MKYLLLPLLLPLATAFECFTCNSLPEEDDTQPCVDKVETCPDGVESCSMVMYVSNNDNQMHIRKFCTSPGTPLYQYLMFFPGSAMCQNVDNKNTNMKFSSKLEPPVEVEPSGFLLERRKKRVSGLPPAPPHSQSSYLLCVCSTDLCNGGSYEEVMNRSMLQNLNDKLGLPDNKVKGKEGEFF